MITFRTPFVAALALALALAAAPFPGAAVEPAAPEADRLPRVGVVDATPPVPSPHDRLAEIRRRIQQAVVYPPVARRRGLEGISRVQFEIRSDGRAGAIGLARSSGHPILDRAARQSVVDAGVLPRVHGLLVVPVEFALR